jgi:DNA-binding FadR family transcriptional regulator
MGAAQAATLAVDEATITALDQYLDAMRAATNADELLDPDLAFHRVIHEASGNVVLLALMTSLRVLTRQSLIASADSADARRDAVVEHRAVLEGLRRRDPIAASTAMRVHLENARQRAAAAARSDASPPAKDRSP